MIERMIERREREERVREKGRRDIEREGEMRERGEKDREVKRIEIHETNF